MAMMMRHLTTAAALLLAAVSAMTPEQMLSAPRYSSAVPNSDGQWAIFSTSTYSFDEHESSSQWKLMNVGSGEISDLPAAWGDEVSEIVWVGDTSTSVLYINGTNEDVVGGVTLWTADVAEENIQGTMVAALPAPYSGLKAVKTSSNDISFLVNCLAYVNGSAYNEELVSTPYTTGRLYNSIYVRHWDTWLTQQRYAVFAGSLTQIDQGYSLAGGMRNLLLGMDAPVTRPETPVQPFGGTGDYDLSPDGSQVVFLTKAPELPKANYTASYLYLVPHDGSAVAQQLNGPGTSAPEEAQGASGGPIWSPDGQYIAYNQQDGISYESDRSKLYVATVESGDINAVAENWDSSVGSIHWDNGCEDLWIASDYWGSTRLFIIPVDAGADFKPENITDVTSVSDFYVLPDGSSLVTAAAVWSSANFYTVTKGADTNMLYMANEQDANLAGLGPQDIDYVWYNGTLGDQQQAIVVYPTDFDRNQVYDLVFYVHGGPQGYTGNVWSTRWNLKTWADQGYVVFGPNPTGSTSYGQDLTDRIQGKWGSWPYEDLVLAHTWACDNLAYVNCSNAVGAGASYGGYMMNWINGHDLGRELNAIVSHDGVATTIAEYGTEELWFINHDFNGTLWESRPVYEKWDPMRYAQNFATPEFVIHNELDYRLPVSEGITMFNALQEQGVPSRFLSFPDENHWVLDPENSLFWHQEVFNWVNFWTGKIDSLDDNAITQ